jgi:hypothetical protein
MNRHVLNFVTFLVLLLPAVPTVSQDIAPSADRAEIRFHAEAAKQILDRGIEELLFIRRFTFNANHVYTD